MNPFGAGAALHSLAPPGHTFSTDRAKKDGARIRMNATAHRKKEEDEETKTGKGRAGEQRKRKQTIDFNGAVCCRLEGIIPKK